MQLTGGFLGSLDPEFSSAIDAALDGREISEEELIRLLRARGPEVHVLVAAADELRRRSVGDVATFVVNRNINFTNECTLSCGFCAFSRRPGDPETYLMSPEDVGRRAEEAQRAGATEVCVQGGISPSVGPEYYISILREIKRSAPGIHVHAFSPQEVHHYASMRGIGVREALAELRDAGLDSMPGTAAEILDDDVRRAIAPRKISTRRWVEIVEEAHRMGIPTTSTMMYGHVDGPENWARHMAIIREIQGRTRGFTEFVLLPFIHQNTPIYRAGMARPGPTGTEDLIVHAAARIFLGGSIGNIQVSWPKLGPKLSQLMLQAGANDVGGTLMEEHISSSAGAPYGDGMSVDELVNLIRGAGRRPAQRSTTYKILRYYD
ncbi:MAG: 5-amino-6-(D-ribitylamino)uracil--L-tyrosine 4-hydroxyphenyl transferase CofH [Nitrososphaeria archaeon]